MMPIQTTLKSQLTLMVKTASSFISTQIANIDPVTNSSQVSWPLVTYYPRLSWAHKGSQTDGFITQFKLCWINSAQLHRTTKNGYTWKCRVVNRTFLKLILKHDLTSKLIVKYFRG